MKKGALAPARFNQDAALGQAATDTLPSSSLGAGPEGEAQQSLSPARAWDGTPSQRAESRPLPWAQPRAETRPTQAQEPASAALDGTVPPRPLGASLRLQGLGERTPAPHTPHLCPCCRGGCRWDPQPVMTCLRAVGRAAGQYSLE